jgi:hypothetical protein
MVIPGGSSNPRRPRGSKRGDENFARFASFMVK